MEKHFVTFLSPGTFVSEQRTMEIGYWDTEQAAAIAHTVVERYGAVPYAFYFTTRERGPDDFDSRETNRSHMYYLGGTILTLEQIEARGDPADRILLSNMRVNGFDRVIVNDNSWRVVQPLRDGDVVIG